MAVTQFKDQDKIENLINDLTIYLYAILERTDLRNDREVRGLLLGINQVLDDFGLEIEDLMIGGIGTQYEEGIKHMTSAIRSADEENRYKGILANLETIPNTDALIELQTDAMLDMKAAIRTAKISGNNAIIGTLDEIKSNLQVGTLTGMRRDKITQMVADTFTKEGMTAFITRDGRRLPLDFYSRVVTRTHLSRAASHGSASRFESVGLDLFTVTGAEPTCPVCARYRGRVFSMSGEDSRFYQLDPYNTFPIHPQCKCIINPYVAEYKSDQQIMDDIATSREFDPNKEDPRYTEKRATAYKKDQEAKRKARKELVEYNQFKTILGNDGPKSLGAFRRMKRGNTPGYEKMRAEVISLRRTDTGGIAK